MKTKSVILILSLAVGLFGSIFFSGCGTKSLEGNRLVNVPPEVQWALIPQDSLRLSANKELKWYGRDVDGQISALDYQYTVVLSDTADVYGGAAAMAADFPDDGFEWTSVGNATQATIPLFASIDTSVFVDQLVFLKCQDDYGDYSNIIYLFLSRNNHPPTCVIFVPDEPLWCLPDTSDYWHGINVSWEGKDSLDYIGIQPDFLWEIRWYGPFADSALADTFSTYTYLFNSETGDREIPLESYTFTDLVTGWYLIYVRNFDDASVPSVPALGFLEVFEPNWIRHPDEAKDVLIVNHSFFASLPGNLPSTWRDSVAIFYENLMADAGIADDKWDWTDDTQPDHSVLYNYRMVITDDIDWNSPITQNPETNYARYLDAGGKIWVIGRYSFANIANQVGRLDYGLNDTHPLAYTYMDLSAAMFPPSSFTDAEFIGANPGRTVDFPILEVDTLKAQGLAPGSFSETIPRIEYLMRNINSETVYTFAAINSDSSGTFHGFPVAVRNENAVFKTSYFSFPLFFIRYDQSVVVANNMLDWFLDR
ncbi:MAG: hypothetical protein V3W18_08585 [candidate division Zixibacteria bacterium]